MTDIPAVYARIVSKRPELEVIHLHWCEDREAAALILAHWLACLPRGACLHHGSDRPLDSWCVIEESGVTHDVKDSPLAALAAFWEAR